MSSPFGQTALTFSSITHELRNTFENLVQTLFGAFEIPTDNHIRSLLDAVKPESLSPMFGFICEP